MSRALREMEFMIRSQRVDLLIETRDARLPLTSLNPAFEHILNSAGEGAEITKRLIVYNKADLAQDCFQEVRGRLGDGADEELIPLDGSLCGRRCGSMGSRTSSLRIPAAMRM